MQTHNPLQILLSFAFLTVLSNAQYLHASESAPIKKSSIQSLLAEMSKDNPAHQESQNSSLSYEALFIQAEQFFEAALYLKAIPIYQQIIQAIRVGEYFSSNNMPTRSYLRYRLHKRNFLWKTMVPSSTYCKDKNPPHGHGA